MDGGGRWMEGEQKGKVAGWIRKREERGGVMCREVLIADGERV